MEATSGRAVPAVPVHAHSLLGRPPSEWETLEQHAERVAALARSFAATFGADDWGELLGRWHDLGKRSAEFQRYISSGSDSDASEEGSHPARVDHSTFGAQHAATVVGGHFGQLLAFCIAGHHGSLPDALSDDEETRRSSLQARLHKAVPSVNVAPEDRIAPPLRLPFAPLPAEAGFQVAFFTRMIFSALIDADRTATEAFCNPAEAGERGRAKPSIHALQTALEAFLRQKGASAKRTPVNRARAEVLADCLAAARLDPGVFSINVPTGGGKTYASLAFSLRHASVHNLRRVIVAIPFTTIIEQTADAYREALGSLADDALLEHHSDITPEVDTRHNKMAAENWDAPLVVTTNVQLYESLFAARGTSCRKLHRLARSVIVLDEAQTIPVEYLRPTLLALRELVAHYSCTVVLCTATQPALERREGEFELGFDNVRPIVKDPRTLFESLRRVDLRWLGKLGDEPLAERLAAEERVLCVVNTRRHAGRLYDSVVERRGEEGCFHLSTFMCAQHRRQVVATIRCRLRRRESCRVISTPLVEAGVDVDFPAVYRASAGFDSIAQSAGRCNREGLLSLNGKPARGRVYAFETDSPPPAGLQRDGAECGRELRDRYPNPMSPDAVEAYFRLFYWTQEHKWDKYEVLPPLTDDFRQRDVQLKFRKAEAQYRLIRDEQARIVVPYDSEARALRDQFLRNDDFDWRLQRAAQRYLVGVHDSFLKALCANGVVLGHASGWWLLVNDRAYSPQKGICPEAVGIDPNLLLQ